MSRRRLGLLWLGLAVLLCWQPEHTAPLARAQFVVPGTTPSPVDAFSIPSDPTTEKRLKWARSYIKTESWDEAIRLLQAIVDAKEDIFLPVNKPGETSGTPTQWISARTEGARLLGQLPEIGYKLYELQYGEIAAGRLADAHKAHDLAAVEELARRYFHTHAGFEATLELAVHYLDRGRFATAAGCFGRQLEHREAGKLTPTDLLHAALAFHAVGEAAQEERVWKLLAARATPDGLLIGGQPLSLSEAHKEVEALHGEAVFAGGWPLFRGDPGRTNAALGGTPFLEARWRAHTLTSGTTASDWVRSGMADLRNHNQPVLPAFFPIAVGDRLVYRTYAGLQAIDLKTGQPAWKQPVLLERALETILDLPDKGKMVQLQNWWRRYLSDWSVVFENATLGTISTDRRLVYVVDDLPFTPPPSLLFEREQYGAEEGLGPFQRPTVEHPEREGSLYFNRLRAFDLATGEPAWSVGGLSDPKSRKVPPLYDYVFLGPPLPLAGKLYILGESNQELRLLCLESTTGELLWYQAIGSATTDKALLDPARRIRGAHLAYADGVLICPTNCGAIVAIDPFTRNLLWAHLYRDRGPAVDPNFGVPNLQPGFLTSGWKAGAPLLHEGKVIFTAADGDTLRCLNLRDGSLQWKVNRLEDDRFLACVQEGKVLVVGRTSCRALNLKDGSEAWTQTTGMPSGQGVLCGGRYYLPLQRGAVCVLNVNTGADPTYLQCRSQDVPGNLLFSEGDLVSQGIDRVTIFPQLEIKLARLAEALRKDPDDPVALSERGQFRLDQGELPGAVADLQRALHHNPPKEQLSGVRDKLYEGLTRLLQRDFTAAEKYLADYEVLCRIEVPSGVSAEKAKQLGDEARRRQIVFRALLARGREQQGHLLDALRDYEELYRVAVNENRLLPLDPSPIESRPVVWAAGRVAGLLARTTGEARAVLDRPIAESWQQLRGQSDPEGLARFVALYGGSTEAGKEATLRLVERSLGRNDPAGWLDAERRLAPLCRPGEDRALAARALELLARAFTQRGLLEDAVACYRRLGTEYTDVSVRDGRTGGQLATDVARDKRFLAYLNPPKPAWVGRKFQVSEVATLGPQHFYLELEPEGDARDRLPPLVRASQFLIDLNEFTTRLQIVDRATGTMKWSVPVNLGPLRQMYAQFGQSMRLPCQVRGHIVCLNLGTTVLALDLADKRVLWQRELPGPGGNLEPRYQPDGTFLLYSPDGWGQTVGVTGPSRAPCVFVPLRTGLLALDPVTGRELWRRTDVTTAAELFGDEECVYLVESRGDGGYGGSRALRVADGASVPIADFTDLYSPPKRLATLGRLLLLMETTGTDEQLALRAYDVATGKDVWKRTYPKGTLLLQSQEQTLTGVVETSGKATVFDAATGKVVLDAQLEKEHLDKVDTAALFRDALHYYIGLKGPPGNDGVTADPYPNLTTTMKNVPLNGQLYAFERTTGKLHWRHLLAHQAVLLEQNEDLPVLLCPTMVTRTVAGAGGGGLQIQEMVTRSYDKRTGKLLFEKRLQSNNIMGYSGVKIDPKSGTIDLVGVNSIVRHTVAK